MQRVLERLAARIVEGRAVVAGVLSGTSADGIDVVLTRFDSELVPRPLAFRTRPFAPDLARRLRTVLDGEPLDARGVALLGRDLGMAFGSAARAVAEQEGAVLELIGSHGQTVWHHDGVEPSGPASLQLGDADFAAAAAGCPVVSDFRQADLAAGGEGAPLGSIVDEVLMRELEPPWAVLNLGGMANLTCMGETRLAFDVGPACSLLDGLARSVLGRERDEDGALAAAGKVRAALVHEILAHPFYQRSPPKSTGRDTFGAPWVAGLLAGREDWPAGDLLASAAEAVARSVVAALGECDELWVAGGGVHHRFLMERLGTHAPCPVRSTALRGVDPDAREALLFALLAARWVLGRPSTQSWASGALPGRVLGRFSPAPAQGAIGT